MLHSLWPHNLQNGKSADLSIHGLSQCLFLGYKKSCLHFDFQVTFTSLIKDPHFVNCLWHLSLENRSTLIFSSFHLFQTAFSLSCSNSYFSFGISLFLYLSQFPAINLSFEFLTYHVIVASRLSMLLPDSRFYFFYTF